MDDYLCPSCNVMSSVCGHKPPTPLKELDEICEIPPDRTLGQMEALLREHLQVELRIRRRARDAPRVHPRPFEFTVEAWVDGLEHPIFTRSHPFLAEAVDRLFQGTTARNARDSRSRT